MIPADLTRGIMTEERINSHVLVDTCFIDKVFRHVPVEKSLKRIFDFKCALCINDLIYLEFIRQAKNKEEKRELEKFLMARFRNISLTQDIFKIAKDTYPLFGRCKTVGNNKQISIVDAVNFAYLKKYCSNLSLITFDLKDYPIEMLARLKTGTIDLENQVLTWGIYNFSKDKFSLVEKHF